MLGFGRVCPQKSEAVLAEIGHFMLTVGDVTQFYKDIKLKAAILCFPRHLWPPSVSSTFPCGNIRELLHFVTCKPWRRLPQIYTWDPFPAGAAVQILWFLNSNKVFCFNEVLSICLSCILFTVQPPSEFSVQLEMLRCLTVGFFLVTK